MADTIERTVHITNYSLPRDQIANELKEKFGPCFVKEPFKPRVEGHTPYGFVCFDDEKDAQACLSARRLQIGSVTLGFAPSKARPSRNDSGQNQNNSNSGFSFGNMNNRASNTHMNGATNKRSSAAKTEPKKCFKAILSHSVGLDELYVQNVSDNRAMDYMKLQEEVNGHCPTAPSVTSPQTGLVYGGLFSEDNAWYRCRLISVQPDRNYLVQFIDYGNQSVVSAENLKDLPQSMLDRPAASVKGHVRDLQAKPGSEQKVNELLGSWYETLLECETSSDGSVDMYNRQKDQTLRAVLINSGLVQGTGNLQNNAPTTTTPNHNNSTVSSDTESVGSQGRGGQRKKNKQNGSASTPSFNNSRDNTAAAVAAYQKEIDTLRKDMNEAKNQVSKMKTIDELNRELDEKLALIRAVRPRFPATTDGTLNKAISLLSDTGYSSDTHNEIFTAVNVLYDKYSALQDSIRQHDTSLGLVDESVISDRDQTKSEFCRSVRQCEEKCTELKAESRREQLNNVLTGLSELYPNVKSEFTGDVNQALKYFTQWQEEDGQNIINLQKITEKALDSLSHHISSRLQGLNLSVNIPHSEDDDQYTLVEKTTQALSAVNDELHATDMTEGSKNHTIITTMCAALISKVSGEFTLLDVMYAQLTKYRGLAVDIEPWLNKSEPDDMTWLQQKEKKLKELRSQLRHRLADLDDLTENDEGSDTEMTDMETQVADVRLEIHSLLLEIEQFIENIAKISRTVLPELVYKHPRLNLNKVQDGRGYLKPLRDIIFYKENYNTETAFNGAPVILKTLNNVGGKISTALPDVVLQLSAHQEQLKSLVNVDAVFYSKNGMNTYVQLSSPNTEVLKYMRDSSPLSVTALVEFISTLPAQEETEFELQTPPTEESEGGGETASGHESDTNIGE